MKELNILVYNDIKKEVMDLLKKRYKVNIHTLSQGSLSRTKVDLVLFNGEENGDIHPDYYSEIVGKHTKVTKSYWDKYGFLRDFMWNYDVPKLGFEEGAQYINVQSGGSLLQHVTGHKETHSMRIRGGRVYNCPSNHHQMMYPYELPTKNFRIIGWSNYFQSNTYLDGRNEERDLIEDFLEPEIVAFSNVKGGALAIQGNPADGSTEYKELCLNYIDSLINRRL